MSETISDSRFNMWRAILALIHADGVISTEEIEFMNHYLSEIPFKEEQKRTLLSDLSDPYPVGELFQEISDTQDRGQFFMFARMLIWCDGDLHAQEEKIFNHIMKTHMQGLNKNSLREGLVSSRDDAKFKEILEDKFFAEQAKNKVGITAILKDWFTL